MLGELSQVVYASNFMHQKDYLTDLAPWYKVGLAEQRAAAARPKDYQKLIFAQRRKERIDDIVRLLGVAPAKVSFVEHHLAHLGGGLLYGPQTRGGKAGPWPDMRRRRRRLVRDGLRLPRQCISASPAPTAMLRSARSTRVSPFSWA